MRYRVEVVEVARNREQKHGLCIWLCICELDEHYIFCGTCKREFASTPHTDANSSADDIRHVVTAKECAK